ncbi:hypothetical protein ACFLWM_00760 [Chloroflexota bacterium]
MAGIKGRSGRRRKLSQTAIEAMGKYQGNLDKLSDELYFMARNIKLTPSVRLQAINLFLEKCVPKFDYKEPDKIWTIPADIIEYYAKRHDEVIEEGRKLLENGKHYDPGGLV